MIEVKPHAEGATLAVRAQPGARKTAVLGEQAGALKVAVTAPPEDGRANDALVEVLKDWLGVKRSQVELHSGAAGRNKKVLVRGVAKAELAARIAALLSPLNGISTPARTPSPPARTPRSWPLANRGPCRG